jgi:hypothetical protein
MNRTSNCTALMLVPEQTKYTQNMDIWAISTALKIYLFCLFYSDFFFPE